MRFLFGFPFALLSLLGVMAWTGVPLPRPGLSFWPWVIDGAGAQIAATATMLMAMNERSFVVTIAYIKTEPIQVAIFGLIFLGDAVTWPMMSAILVATAGVIVMSSPSKPGGMVGGIRPTVIGLVSGGLFALSAIGYRGAILEPRPAEFRHGRDVHAGGRPGDAGSHAFAFICVLRRPSVMMAILRSWKPSLFAGLMGALASQFWFLAFAIATAASVRTLALIEVLFAQGVSRFMFGQRTTAREAAGMALVVAGVLLLIFAEG